MLEGRAIQDVWIAPARHGRKVGEDNAQEYRAEDGKRVQWLFTKITGNSFHWINRDSANNGESWNIRSEFFLNRRAAD